jgi:DNA repair exonuclease SbcCD ATPase subunit
MGQVVPITITLTEISCGECAGVYAINERVRQRHQDMGTSWNCPYCRVGWGFAGKGKVQQLEKQLQDEQARLAEEKARHQRTLARENEERTAKEKAERKLKRVQRGVCPSCNRTFNDLARHMASTHAETCPGKGAKK